MEDVLAWAEEEDQPIGTTEVEAAWGEVAPTHEHIEDVVAKSTQLYAVLQTLCEGEAFTIVRSAGKHNGLDAWRRLVRRFDPSTGGRRRTLLRHLLNPAKCTKIEELSRRIEQWEEQLRLYQNRKRSDGTRHELDEEIRLSVLEHLCPVELERHLQMNRSRYKNYQEMRAEVSLYLETRSGAKLKAGDAGRPATDPDAMDIGTFGKGKGGNKSGDKGKGKGKDASKSRGKNGKGKGKGASASSSFGSGKGPKKEERKCHNCGKVGHLVKDCWSAGGGQANKSKGSGKGNGKDKGKKSKGVSNLEDIADS